MRRFLHFLSIMLLGIILLALSLDNLNAQTIPSVTNPITGRTWMDRNLGASQVATSSTDSNAYGDLYQWGRYTDGHEKRNSDTISTLSISDSPGHANFIITGDPYDWRNPKNNSLWQGTDGINNPCPNGYRLPTEEEWETELESWNSKDQAGAFASPLKLPVSGGRSSFDGSLFRVGEFGYYWSSSLTSMGILPRPLFITGSAAVRNFYRTDGCSVRCIMDDDANATSINIHNVQDNLFIYPNPATDKLYIHVNSTGFWGAIYNIQGKCVAEIIAGATMVDISHLSKGVYFVNIFDAGKIKTRKLIKR